MELRVLRYFLAVAQEESISRAADKLHITQPTLSRQLMDLEIELDTRLFDRSRQSRSITLTKEGWRFLQRAKEIVELADRTAAEFRPEPDALEGDLYIGLPEPDGRYSAPCRTVHSGSQAAAERLLRLRLPAGAEPSWSSSRSPSRRSARCGMLPA